MNEIIVINNQRINERNHGPTDERNHSYK